MAIKKCKECQHTVSTKAETCPGCGAILKRRTGCLGLIFAGFLAVFSFVIFSSIVSDIGSRSPGKSTASPAPASSTSLSSRTKQSSPSASTNERHLDDGKIVVAAQRAVRMELRDPDSAKFRDIRYGESEETGPAVFGHVNSRNALGGYTGFVKFVSDGKTTLIEGRDPRAVEAWQNLYFSAVTEQTLAALPQTSQVSPTKVNILKLAGKTVKEVNAQLGEPSSREKVRQGNKLIYEQKEVEVVFKASKANLITVSNLESVPFTPSAITALGLPVSRPSFASEHVLRWKNIQGILEISIGRGQKGCDFAYVIVNQRP